MQREWLAFFEVGVSRARFCGGREMGMMQWGMPASPQTPGAP
jgi:hypothetical protein